MIKNERQYRITKTQAERFARTLANLRQRPPEEADTPPLIAQAQEDAVRSQLADLEDELREYESLKRGNFEFDQLGQVAELPTVLIRARIAQGLSQKDLATRLDVDERQIQRYEATDYAAASLSRIREVASVLYRAGEDTDDESLTGSSQPL